jgi:peptide/nickel transport system ATP-binding protein
VKLATIKGSVPELVDLPAGCPFAGRCSYTVDACLSTRPPPVLLPHDHQVRCIRLDEIAAEEGEPA